MLCVNFKTPYLYTMKTDRDSLNPSVFHLQPISYKTFSYLYSFEKAPEGLSKINHTDLLLQESITHVDNLEDSFYLPSGKLKPIIWTQVLPLESQQDLIELISNLFLPSKEFYDTLKTSLELAVNPRYSGEDWNCTRCQERKLHFQRNCYLVPKEEHEASISYQVLDEIVTECPINKKDPVLLDATFHARNYSESGFLPEEGSIGSQTVFFVVAYQKAASVINYHQNKRMEESNKTKR